MSPGHRNDRPAPTPVHGGDRRNARASLRRTAILHIEDSDKLSNYRVPREIAVAFLEEWPIQARLVGAWCRSAAVGAADPVAPAPGARPIDDRARAA